MWIPQLVPCWRNQEILFKFSNFEFVSGRKSHNSKVATSTNQRINGFSILRACLKSSNEDGNEGKRENLSGNVKFAFTIFPKSAEFVEPAEKTLYHPAAWQNDKLV